MNMSFSTSDSPSTDDAVEPDKSPSPDIGGKIEAENKECVLVEAINMALHYEMARDDSVVVLGEDVATNGGVFRATLDLKQTFGAARVLDTPLPRA